MKKTLFALLMLIVPILCQAQETRAVDSIAGKVINVSTDEPLEGVNIINLNSVKGAVTDAKGNFALQAKVNDTLYFSFLGFKTLQVRVTSDWKKFGEVKIKMTEVGIALEEVVVNDTQLTGYLEIDAKNVPIYKNFRYSISGLDMGYEAGDSQPTAINKVINSVFNPADFLYKAFGKRPRQMKKLREMKDDDNIRNLLLQKFDRETLAALLQVTTVDIDEILRRCDYSESFVKTANDLQILDAISSCYEEYKVLNREKAP